MKSIMTRIFLGWCMLLTALVAQAQPFPISTEIALMPPYPTNLDAYVDYLERGIIEVNSTNSGELDVFFEIKLEETSGKISLNTNGVLGTSITIAPGSNLLTPSQIQDIFSDLTEADFITSGLSQAERDAIILNRQIPEGSYRLCVDAFDESGNRLSDPSQGCVIFDVFFAERPVINLPEYDEVVDPSSFLLINWEHIINSPDIQNRLEYILKIIDLTEQEITNYELAMLDPAVSPEYEEDFGNTFAANLQADIDLPLVPRHKYAIRVTAVDPSETLGFQFGGHSEIVIFSYGEAEEEEEEDGALTAPTITAPDHEDFLGKEEPLRVNITWEHEIEDEDLQALLAYEYKMIDLTELDETTYDYDDFTEENMFKTEACDIEDPQIYIANGVFDGDLEEDHTYAVFIEVSSEDDRIEFENDGRSSIVEFTLGDEEVTPDAEEGCGGDCLATLPTDQKATPIKKGDNLFMGNLMLTVDEVEEDPNGGYMGEGSIFVNFIKQIHIKVDFSGIEANKQKYVFAGEAAATYDETIPKLDGLIATAGSNALDIDFEAAKGLSSALLTGGKLASALAGEKTALPLGFDRDVAGDKMIVGITEMNFTPEKATMTALFSIENPDWGDYVPTLGATDICFTRSGFGEVVKLYLGEDYTIPLSNEQLILKASEENTAGEKGTYCIIDCKGFKEGQLTAEVGIPREVLLPENEDGTIAEDGFAKLLLSGTFTKGSGFLLGASMSPCQIPGLEGFSLTMEEGYYDASDEANPDNLAFPKGYSRSETDELWKGVWFSNVSIQAPLGWAFADEDSRLNATIDNFIKDPAGVTLVGNLKNMLSIENGEFEGFAVSMDSLSINIVRNQFLNVSLSGQLGLPILPEDSYLSYTGLIDKSKEDDKATNNNGPAVGTQTKDTPPSLSFTITPDENGYYLPWIKSTIKFNENTQIELKNDTKEKGVSALLEGTIAIGDYRGEQEDPEPNVLKFPALEFTGMAISSMTDKTPAAKGKKKGLQFTGPTFSFVGGQWGNDKDEEEETPEEDKEEEEEEEAPKVNGFNIGLTKVALTMGDGSDKQEIADGTSMKLEVEGEVELVRAAKKKQGKKKAQKGLELAATGSFSILANVIKNENRYRFEYDRFDAASLTIDSKIGPIGVEGSLELYTADEDFGKGFVGEVTIDAPMLNVGVEARFGNKEIDDLESFSYFYLFGKVDIEAGILIPQTPIKLHRFLGGAYANMSIKPGGELAEKARDKYIPNPAVSFGFKAGLGFSVVSPSTAFANMDFEMALTDNGGIERIAVGGQLDMMQEEPFGDLSGEDFEGLRLKGVATILPALENKDGSYVEGREDLAFKFNFAAKANIADETIIGNKAFAMVEGEKVVEPYLITDGKFNIKGGVLDLELGRLDNKGSILAKLGDQAGIEGKFYLQASMGKTVDFPTAPVPDFITRLLAKSKNEDFTPGGDDINDKLPNTHPTDGLAMIAGLNINAKAEVDYSIVYASFQAMLGFDLSLQTNKNIVCSNNGDAPLGMGQDGYYAQGQVYAGLEGDVGLDVDVFGYKGKIRLAYVYAAMLVQGGFANPSWIKGSAGIGYEVLGGLLKGNTNFEIAVGEKCEAYTADPFSGVKFIEGIDPSPSKTGVSPFVKPILSFENKIGRYEFKNKNGQMMWFDVRLEEFKINGKSFTKKTASDRLSAHLDVTSLTPNKWYSITAKIKVYKWNGTTWLPAKDSANNLIQESLTNSFRTGEMPNYVPWSNVKDCYPFRNEKYYMVDDNRWGQGIVKLGGSQKKLFEPFTPAGQQWHSKVYATLGDYQGQKWLTSHEVKYVESYKNGSNIIVFNIPKDEMKPSRDYQLKLERRWYKNTAYDTSTKEIQDKRSSRYESSKNYSSYTFEKEGKHYTNAENKRPKNSLVFEYFFKSSRYRTFADKVNWSGKFNGRQNYAVLQYKMQNKEQFSQEELGYKYIAESRTLNKEMAFAQEDMMFLPQATMMIPGYLNVKKRFQQCKNWSYTMSVFSNLDFVDGDWKKGLDPKSLKNRHLYDIWDDDNMNFVSTFYTKISTWDDIKKYDYMIYHLVEGDCEDWYDDKYESEYDALEERWYGSDFDASYGFDDWNSLDTKERNHRSQYYLNKIIHAASNTHLHLVDFKYSVPYYSFYYKKYGQYQKSSTKVSFTK